MAHLWATDGLQACCGGGSLISRPVWRALTLLVPYQRVVRWKRLKITTVDFVCGLLLKGGGHPHTHKPDSPGLEKPKRGAVSLFAGDFHAAGRGLCALLLLPSPLTLWGEKEQPLRSASLPLRKPSQPAESVLTGSVASFPAASRSCRKTRPDSHAVASLDVRRESVPQVSSPPRLPPPASWQVEQQP